MKLLTKSKEKWEVAIDDVAKGLSEKYSSAVTAKVLWLLGEMGLKYPLRVQEYIGKIANYLENNNPKLRERAVNAIGRIGRADKNLVLPYLDKLMKMVEDEADNVRLSFIWACENIAMNAPELFCENLKLFYKLMQDKAERVRIEAPEMFRVMGKRKPKVVEPYLNKLQWFADNDQHPVVRIHSAGAIRITEKALQDCV
ncbi:sister chromatid cohesion protein PDS5 [Porphyromonas crevioricanis]|uniref:sister chromatid cohesion protein PDS5 n=1 Tax=Porphyromonas crevioricanis TaxID=393921 RepID=UPI000A8CE022|nr:sister chromatid cohesion protein PDS5 [Porphyromonas crevioricanis]